MKNIKSYLISYWIIAKAIIISLVSINSISSVSNYDFIKEHMPSGHQIGLVTGGHRDSQKNILLVNYLNLNSFDVVEKEFTIIDGELDETSQKPVSFLRGWWHVIVQAYGLIWPVIIFRKFNNKVRGKKLFYP